MAVSTILVSIVASVILLNFLASNLTIEGKQINLAGSQRMRSQRLAQLSQRLEKGENVRSELEQTNKQFRIVHYALLNGNDSLHLPTLTDPILLEAFSSIEKEFLIIHENVNKLLRTQISKTDEIRSLHNILISEKEFLLKMDSIVNLYEIKNEKNILRYRLIEVTMAGIVLVIILLIVFYVFKPLYKNLLADMDRLAQMELVLKQVENTMVITDPSGMTIWVNDAFKKLTGFEKKDIIGKKPGDVLQGELTDEETIEKIRYGLKTKAPFYVEIINYHKLGLPYWLNLQITPVLDKEGNVEKFISVQSDISERKNAEDRIKKKNLELENKNETITKTVKELTELSTALNEQGIELHTQQKILKNQNKKITESINYAKRIQNAITSDDYILNKYFTSHFIYNKPKDIVSGDFLWTSKIENKIYIVVADCTGHGVPGAIMSTIGVSLLDRITAMHGIKKPNAILQILQFELKKLLKRNDSSVNDGMDLGVIVIDLKLKELQFSGAHHNVLLFKKSSIDSIENVKGDKYGIGGIYAKKFNSFTLHSFDLEDIHRFYMFTDGVKDQFGSDDSASNAKETKFTQRRMIQILEAHCSDEMDFVEEVISEKISQWQGQRKQTDDMLMVGVEINHEIL